MAQLTEKYSNKKDFKRAFKSSSGTSSGLFRRFKADEECRVRFLTEMDQWERGYYHWLRDSVGKSQFLWCSRQKDCAGCKAEDRPKTIWLANALVREDGKVQILQIPASIAKMLNRKDESLGTICDRDYKISRTGTTLEDTEYFLDWDDKKPFNASRYKPADIPNAIMTELGLTDEDSTEDDDDTDDEFADLDRSGLKEELKKLIPDFVAKKSQTDEDLLALLRETASASSDDEDEQDDEWDDEDDDIDTELKKEEKRRAASKKTSSSSKSHSLDGLNEFRKKPAPKKAAASSTKRVIRRAN